MSRKSILEGRDILRLPQSNVGGGTIMQTARLLGGLAVLFIAARAVLAEPTKASIATPEAIVRSGPSPEFYATGKLRQGDAVRVVGEEVTGWLAIVPPAGSFSWIHT